jgi:rhamnosyltransferase
MEGIAMVPLHANVGLATAQNSGIAWAKSHGFSHVLLLDQDSTPGDDMVQRLLEVLASRGHVDPVAAVGPMFEDERDGTYAPFVKIGFPMNRRLWCERSGQIIACDFLISSGSLIPLEVVDVVGAMDDALFIDNVDLEWCFRARSLGYQLYGVCAATMGHQLGDTRRRLPLGLGQVVVHGPTRLYYIMRNRLQLYRKPHTPRMWVAQDVPRALMKLLLFGVLIGPRLRNLRFMLRGLWDGLRNRGGACPLI